MVMGWDGDGAWQPRARSNRLTRPGPVSKAAFFTVKATKGGASCRQQPEGHEPPTTSCPGRAHLSADDLAAVYPCDPGAMSAGFPLHDPAHQRRLIARAALLWRWSQAAELEAEARTYLEELDRQKKIAAELSQRLKECQSTLAGTQMELSKRRAASSKALVGSGHGGDSSQSRGPGAADKDAAQRSLRQVQHGSAQLASAAIACPLVLRQGTDHAANAAGT